MLRPHRPCLLVAGKRAVSSSPLQNHSHVTTGNHQYTAFRGDQSRQTAASSFHNGITVGLEGRAESGRSTKLIFGVSRRTMQHVFILYVYALYGLGVCWCRDASRPLQGYSLQDWQRLLTKGVYVTVRACSNRTTQWKVGRKMKAMEETCLLVSLLVPQRTPKEHMTTRGAAEHKDAAKL